MAYTKESLRKYNKSMRDAIEMYCNSVVDDLIICISTGNKKIGRVMNVSLAPIRTCANCSECLKLCYDIKACLFRPVVLKARARNTFLALNHPEIYFSQIRKAISKRRKNKYFRWHVGGDIPTYEYFCEMVAIAREYPDFTFWTYTKNYKIVNRYVRENGNCRFKAIPQNLSIMFSEWDGMELINPYNFPIFTVKFEKGNLNHEKEFFDSLYKCPSNCDICKECGRGCINGESTYVNEH